MVYTRHGHQIMGTVAELPKPKEVARCGGPGLCDNCSIDAAMAVQEVKMANMHLNVNESRDDFVRTAREMVVSTINNQRKKEMNEYLVKYEDSYCVWFCKVLKNWKALVSTVIPDGKYYEVTYDGTTGETYVDVYVKTDNVVVPNLLTQMHPEFGQR